MKKILFVLLLVCVSRISFGQCVINCPANISVSASAGQCGKVVTYDLPTTSNCGGAVAGSQTFNHTASVQIFTVPAGVTSIKIKAWGAEGGSAANNEYYFCATWQTMGGNGGYAEGDLIVTPGQVLQVYVGGAGGAGAIGGFNGGGKGKSANFATTSTGGGASDIRTGTGTLSDRVLVAAGGGGQEWNNGCNEAGGGGGLTGGTGCGDLCERSGGGGTQLMGGTAVNLGFPPNDGHAGDFGIGGNSAESHSGGGGGGYYGGGSGAGDGAGGGGSSYIDGVSNGTTISGVQEGDGKIEISWDAAVEPTVSQTAGLASGAVFPTGVTTNTFKVIDGNGDAYTCNFTVTVTDDENPAVTCPFTTTQSKTVNNSSYSYAVSGTEFNATATDNCSATLSYTLSGATSGTGTLLAGVALGQGTTLISWKATDPTGNKVSCSFSVTVCLPVDTDGDGDPNATDCAPLNPAIYHGATEICNGKDDDCDGYIDEGVQNTYYKDYDGDGFGNKAYTKKACYPPSGYVANCNDCNDHDKTIYPGAPELCDYKDNDCDGKIDEYLTKKTYYKDADCDGYGDRDKCVSACKCPSGYVTNNKDCNDRDKTIYPGAKEVCDNKDNDCDGVVDEGFTKKSYYRDYDKDGYGDPKQCIVTCSPCPSGYVTNNKDCNDSKKSVHPGAAEIAGNKIDDNCNGKVDEKAATLARGSNDQLTGDEPKELLNTTNEVLKVKVLPNPSPNYFTLNLKSGSDKPVQLRVVDIAGRLVETKNNIPAGSILTIGHSYRPGIYFVEVMQGTERVVKKCIKQ